MPQRERNPFEFVQPVVVNKPKINFYNKENLARLMEVVAHHESYLEFMLTAFYGLRRSEVIGINYKDGIDFENKRVILKYSVLFQDGAIIIKPDLKNRSSEAAMPLTPDVEKIIRQRIAWIEKNKKIYGKEYFREYDGFLCVDALGHLKRPDTLSHQLHHVVKKHGLPPITMHGLRHTCASILLAENKNLKEIQEWLRHSDITTTMNMYAHLDAAKKEECATAMSGVFGFAPQEKTETALDTLKQLLAENPDLIKLLTEERQNEDSGAEM